MILGQGKNIRDEPEASGKASKEVLTKTNKQTKKNLQSLVHVRG